MVELSPEGKKRFSGALEDAKRALHKSDMAQGKQGLNKEEVVQLRHALRALMQAVEELFKH